METTFTTSHGRELTAIVSPDNVGGAGMDKPIIAFLHGGHHTGYSYYAETLAGRDFWGRRTVGAGLLLDGGSGESLSAEERTRLRGYAERVCDAVGEGGA